MLSRLVRLQLLGFTVVTVVSLALIAMFYLRIPRWFGYGEYRLTMKVPEAAGLYPNALVTYRGVEIGRVDGLTVQTTDVEVALAIDDEARVPADIRAEVLSTSAVGEQYVNLVSVSGRAGGPMLSADDVITADRVKLPVSTMRLLDGVDRLLESVPKDSLITTVDELYRAFNGSSDDLQRLMDSAIAFQNEADANLEPTLDLLQSLVPVLQTQRGLAGEIQSYTADLASFTGQLAASDTDLRAAIHAGGPFARQLDGIIDDLRPTLPSLLADLATTGQVAEAYLPAIEHVLIVGPAAIVELQNMFPPSREDDPFSMGSLDFKLSVNNPPICDEGFELARRHRDPGDLSTAPLPLDSYCKVPRNDPRIVRGARNAPCPNVPGRRAATAAGCGLIFDRVTAPGAAQPTRSLVPDRADVTAAGSGGELYRMFEGGPSAPRPTTWQQLLRAPLGLPLR